MKKLIGLTALLISSASFAIGDTHSIRQQVALKDQAKGAAMTITEQISLLDCGRPISAGDWQIILGSRSFNRLADEIRTTKGIVGVRKAREILEGTFDEKTCQKH